MSVTVTTLPNNNAPADPALKDLLDLLKKEIMLSLSAHHVGTVQSFNALRQTATATINYKKTFFQFDAATGLYQPVLFDYPLLLDCPVICLGGGAGALSFPIRAGDECLVLFNDRDIDNWFAGSSNSAVATPRLHSTADGLILVGLRSLGNVLTNYDSDRACLRGNKAGTTIVGVGEALVKIANAQYTLNNLLQELITDVKALVTATAAITVTGVTPGGGVSGPPVNAAAISAAGTALTATAVKIAGLLE